MRPLRILAVLALLVLPGAPAFAISGGTLTDVTFDCDSITVTFTDVTFDRDNTGANEEASSIVITDGNNNVLFSDGGTNPVGSVQPGSTQTLPYTSAAVVNPIRVLLTSSAGNGFPLQTVWDAVGDCPDLPASGVPTAPVTALGALLLGLIVSGSLLLRRRRATAVHP
jgi:hypothetical protein